MSFFDGRYSMREGVITSVIIISLIGIARCADAKILEIDTKWIVFASSPIIIALFTGGYISSFKGFGITLAAKLAAPIGNERLKDTDAIDYDKRIEKKGELDPENQDARILSFISPRENYYEADAVHTYLSSLPCLQYFQVTDAEGRLKLLLATDSLLRAQQEPIARSWDPAKIDRFVNAVADGSIEEKFGKQAAPIVKEEDTLVAVLKLLRKKRRLFAAVVNKGGELEGVAEQSALEHRLANQVLDGYKA